jgi:SpoVK/Ycf46/Vps4 family AAA+-type ATPase
MAKDSPLHAVVLNEPLSMNGMVGLESLVSKISAITVGADYRNLAAYFGAKISTGFQNALIVGPQGTGKTTFAKVLAFEYRKAGLIAPTSPIMFVDAVDLAGEYVGQSEEKTKKLLHSIIEGVIIIDEIDSLMDIGHFGSSVLNTLNAHMGNAVNSPIIIATCYASRKEELLAVNKGLEGRFRHIMHMPEYNTDNLTDMFIKKILHAGLIPGNDVAATVKDLLAQIKKAKGPLFAHAREVQNIFDAVIDAHAARLHQEGIDFSQIGSGERRS